jgi:hypothetical protein
MDKIFQISKSQQEVYSKSGGTKVVKFESTAVNADELKNIVRRYNYSACRWFSGNKKGPRFIPDKTQTGVGHCSNDSFAEMYGIILDVDEGLSLTEAQTLFKDYKGVIFASSSHQLEKKRGSSALPACDRFRVLLPFNDADYITDVKTARDMTKAALNRWTFADQSCVDPARKYFPTTGEPAGDDKFIFIILGGDRFLGLDELRGHVRIGNALDNEVADKTVSKEMKKHNDKVETFSLNDTTFNENKELVTYGELLETDKEANVYCSFCDDINSESRSAVFYPTNWRNIPSLFCQHCKSEGDGFNKNGIYYLNAEEAYDIVVRKTGKIAFLDKNTNKLFFGAYDPFMESYTIDQKDFSTVKNALTSHHIPIPKVYPEVRYTLVPNSDKIVDLENGFVNRYIAPVVLKDTPQKGKTYKVPKYIGLLLEHMIEDKDMRSHFYNWLASIVQRRSKVRTAFLLQGVQGIGKNLFYDLVIKQIFGHAYCTEVHQNKFLSNFNSFISRNVWVLVNEVEIDFGTKGELASKLKPFITDDWLESEAKGQDSKIDRNHCNTIFFSNKRNAVYLEKSDRRFNVVEYVEQAIKDTPWWPGNSIEQKLLSEVHDFCMYLKSYPVDYDAATIVWSNEARAELIQISETNREEFFSAVKRADFEFLQDNVMEDLSFGAPSSLDLKTRIHTAQLIHKISRDDLYSLFNNICQAKKTTLAQFSKTCTQYGVPIKTTRIEGMTIRGFTFPGKPKPGQKPVATNKPLPL